MIIMTNKQWNVILKESSVMNSFFLKYYKVGTKQDCKVFAKKVIDHFDLNAIEALKLGTVFLKNKDIYCSSSDGFLKINS
jgi:hypothetical protein